jgi:hypothetical protein
MTDANRDPKELLHLEYLEKEPKGYRYTQFCEHYRAWLKKRGLTMRQEHRAGEKLFVDYSGKKPRIVDPKTGEVIEVELFVAALGASNYTFAEATHPPGQMPDGRMTRRTGVAPVPISRGKKTRCVAGSSAMVWAVSPGCSWSMATSSGWAMSNTVRSLLSAAT